MKKSEFDALIKGSSSDVKKLNMPGAQPDAKPALPSINFLSPKESLIKKGSEFGSKMEVQFFAEFESQHKWLVPHAMTFRLGDDCRYTPDFMAIKDNELIAYEIKGFMRDDALVKIKVASRLFGFIRFVLVTREGTKSQKQWKFRDIK